jgi:outer membrane lipase/esterase
MQLSRFATRSNFLSIFSAVGAAVCLLGPQSAMAQVGTPIYEFLGDELRDTNLGQSALAVQRTCIALIPQAGVRPPGSSGEELFLRCGELVTTARDLAGLPGSTARTLGYTDGNELLSAFQQVNGEEVQASATMAAGASNDQISSIAARLGALRGATSVSVTSVAANATEFMFGSGGGAAADDAGSAFSPWGWFLRGTYTSGDRDPSDPMSFSGQENGFDFDQYGMTVGIDHISGAAVWGLAVTYSSYEVTMQDAGVSGIATQVVDSGTIEADSINGSFYFDYSGQNNGYLTTLVGYGQQSFDMARNFNYFRGTNATAANVVDQTRSLIAAPDGDSIAASVALGRLFSRGSALIDPHLGVTYDRISIDQFSEADSGNTNSAATSQVQAMQLAFAEQKIDSLRANIGVQFSNNVNTSFGSVRPTLTVDYYHEFEDDPRNIKVKYALEDTLAADNAPGFSTGFDNCTSCFNLASEAPDPDYFVVGAGIAAAYQNGIQTFLMFESLLGYENLSAYSVTLGLRGHF